MSVEEIERAIAKLSAKERAKLLARLAKVSGDQWDKQIEAEIRAGKFQKLADKALAEHKMGLSKKL